MSIMLSNLARLFAIFLVIITMTLGHSSAALAESKKRVTVNQVMHAAFLMRKSRMVSSLQRSLHNISHKGSFFPGEIAEIKGIASDLKKVKFQVQELPQGFLLIAEKDQLRASVGIEFVDPLMGIIRVGGHTIQLKKGMSYLELAKTIAPAILPTFLKESKPKKTSFNDNPLHWLIPNAWGEEERILRYERPKDLPKPYKKLLDIAAGKVTGAADVVFITGGLAYVGTLAAFGSGVAASAVAVGAAGVAGAAVGGAVGAAVGAGAGVVAAVGGAGAGAAAAAGAGAGVVAAAGAVGGVVAGLGLFVGGLYLIDTVKLGLSKIDDLDRVGGHLNSILDLCMESREKYYKKSPLQQLAQLDGKRVASFAGNELKKFQVFQQLWRVSHSSQGQNIAESSQIACNELVEEEGLERLRSKGIAVPGDEFRFRGSERYAINQERRARGERALNALCRAYEGIVRCYSSVSSPYGERVGTKKSAISNERAIKEQGGYLWDFYQSQGGSSVLE